MEDQMEAPKIQVRCGVENCRYNKGRTCHADNVEVNPMEMGNNKAESSDATCCSTFKNHETM